MTCVGSLPPPVFEISNFTIIICTVTKWNYPKYMVCFNIQNQTQYCIMLTEKGNKPSQVQGKKMQPKNAGKKILTRFNIFFCGKNIQ